MLAGHAENTNSIIYEGSREPEAANGCPVLLESRDPSHEAQVRN